MDICMYLVTYIPTTFHIMYLGKRTGKIILSFQFVLIQVVLGSRIVSVFFFVTSEYSNICHNHAEKIFQCSNFLVPMYYLFCISLGPVLDDPSSHYPTCCNFSNEYFI
jgi:hypothetical protein